MKISLALIWVMLKKQICRGYKVISIVDEIVNTTGKTEREDWNFVGLCLV